MEILISIGSFFKTIFLAQLIFGLKHNKVKFSDELTETVTRVIGVEFSEYLNPI